MELDAARLERWFVGVLVALGAVDIVLTVVINQQYIGTLLTDLLVLGFLALIADLFIRYGTRERWTVLASALLIIGGVIDASVTLIGFPSIPPLVPKLIWAIGLIYILYELYGVRRRQQDITHSSS